MKRSRLWITAALLVALVPISCMTPDEEVFSSQRKANWKDADAEALTAAKEGPPPEIRASTHIAAANLFEGQGLFAKAITQYRKAIEVEPRCAEAHSRLGILLGKLGQHSAAEEHLLKAVQILPRSPALRNNLGFEYAMQERWTDAEVEIRNAIALKPDFTRAYINLGMVLCKQDRYQEGQEAFQEAVSEADALYNVGLMYRSAQRYREAAETFRTALAIDPQMTAARTQLEQIADRVPAEATRDPIGRPTAVAQAPSTNPPRPLGESYTPRIDVPLPPPAVATVESTPPETPAVTTPLVAAAATPEPEVTGPAVPKPTPAFDRLSTSAAEAPTRAAQADTQSAAAAAEDEMAVADVQVATLGADAAVIPPSPASETTLSTVDPETGTPDATPAPATSETAAPMATTPRMVTAVAVAAEQSTANPAAAPAIASAARPADPIVEGPTPVDSQNAIADAGIIHALAAPDPVTAWVTDVTPRPEPSTPQAEAASGAPAVRLAVRFTETTGGDSPTKPAPAAADAQEIAGPPAAIAPPKNQSVLEILCEHWLSMNWVFDDNTPPMRMPACDNEPGVFTPRLRFNPNWHVSRPGSVLIHQDPFDQVEEFPSVNWEFPEPERD